MLDADKVLQIAIEHELILHLSTRPGQFVVRGSPLARAWPAERLSEQITSDLNRACVLGDSQTQQQDIRFVMEQLVEIAVRALSPGINDPFTAIRCIDRLGAALCHLSEHNIPGPDRYDATGRLRVIGEAVTFRELVDIAFDQIRHYGCKDAAVTRRLLEVIAQIASYSQDAQQRAALRRQAELIWRRSQANLPEQQDQDAATRRYQEALKLLNKQRSRN